MDANLLDLVAYEAYKAKVLARAANRERVYLLPPAEYASLSAPAPYSDVLNFDNSPYRF